MPQFEIELEDDAKSGEELREELSTHNFLDIVAPENLQSEINELDDDISSYKKKKQYNFWVLLPGAGFSTVLPITTILEPGVLGTGLSLGSLVTTGASFKAKNHFEDCIDELEDEKDDLFDIAENWYKVPGTVNLSYLVNQGLEREFEVPYEEWLSDNMYEWSKDSFVADMANQEMKDLGIEDVEVSTSAFDYGVQKIYFEELNEEKYKFVLQVYDEVEDEPINSYWGITDEEGKRIVEQNDGVEHFGKIEED